MTQVSMEFIEALRDECARCLTEYRESRTEAAAVALADARAKVEGALQQWWTQGCK